MLEVLASDPEGMVPDSPALPRPPLTVLRASSSGYVAWAWLCVHAHISLQVLQTDSSCCVCCHLVAENVSVQAFGAEAGPLVAGCRIYPEAAEGVCRFIIFCDFILPTLCCCG